MERLLFSTTSAVDIFQMQAIQEAALESTLVEIVVSFLLKIDGKESLTKLQEISC